MENEELKIDPVFKQLVERALADEKHNFEFICCLPERTAAKVCIKATKKVIKLFKALEEETAMTYVESIKRGKQDLQVLMAHMQFKKCIEFYTKEVETLKDMLKEYRAYVFGGNLMKTLLGIYRSDNEKVDFRTLPWQIF